MIALSPGGTGWLLRHELRLHWRGLRQQTGSRIASSVVFVLLHLIAIPLAMLQTRLASTYSPDAIVVAALVFTLLLMISRTLVTAVQALHARGDMDLLLSSPLNPAAIVSVRIAAIAVSAAFEIGFLLVPFVNVFVLFGHFVWAQVYLLIPALAMLAATISLAIALQLSRWLGPRRTRVASQIVSAIVGIVFVLSLQLPNLLSRKRAESSALRTSARELAAQMGEPLTAAGQALLHSPVPAIALTALCLAIFAVASRSFGPRFVTASVAASGQTASKAKPTAPTFAFRQSIALILMSKELRLMRRDSWLITQVLQQAVFILPMGIALWRTTPGGLSLIWMLTIMLAASTAGALAWVTVTAEDAPDLIKSAPVTAGTLLRYKLQAALLPVVPVIVLPLLALASTQLWYGFSVTVCSAGSAVTGALLNADDTRTGNRRDFRSRYKGSFGRAMLALFVIMLWYALCSLLIWLGPT